MGRLKIRSIIHHLEVPIHLYDHSTTSADKITQKKHKKYAHGARTNYKYGHGTRTFFSLFIYRYLRIYANSTVYYIYTYINFSFGTLLPWIFFTYFFPSPSLLLFFYYYYYYYRRRRCRRRGRRRRGYYYLRMEFCGDGVGGRVPSSPIGPARVELVVPRRGRRRQHQVIHAHGGGGPVPPPCALRPPRRHRPSDDAA